MTLTQFIMNSHTLIISISILLSIIHTCTAAAESKYVRIDVDAKWPQTSIILEASEFIASVDKEKFWNFIELFDNLENHDNSKEAYSDLMQKAGSILSNLEVDMMKFALSTRTFSPKLEVYRQVIKETGIPDCDTVFSFKGKHFCEFEELVSDITSSTEGNQTQVKYFDHVYPQSSKNNNVVILYGLLGTKSFNAAHKKMKELVHNNNVRYILRHHIKSPLNGKVHLSGYGVELAIKSTEYKAVDDQKVQGGDSVKRRGQQDHEDEVDGFLFGKLRDLHHNLKDELQSFRTHLKESNKELAELKVWQLQDLSFQAAQRVMSSSPDQRLKVLRDISQNLPMLTKSLVKTSVKDELKNEVKKNQEKFKQANIDVGEAGLFINGLPIQLDSLDAFSLQNLLVKEMDVLKELDVLGLEADRASEVVAVDVKPSHDNYAVDIRSESVQWLNDLEKDAQYAYWPSNLEEILRPTFPGMLRYIAKNIFHVVVCINPTDQSSIALFKTVQDFVSNSMPARFGVLFVADGSPEDDGMLDAGIAITRAFSFIKAEKSLKEAFDFVTEIYKRSDQKAPAASDVTNLFKRWYGEDDLKDALSPNTDYDDLRRNSYQLFKRLGLKSFPHAFMNGIQFSDEEIESMESSLIDKILTNTHPIQQATYTGHIFNQPTIYDYVMSQPNVVKRLNPMIQTTAGEYIIFGGNQYSGPGPNMADSKEIESLSKEDILNGVSKNLKYFLNEKGMITVWVVADADTNVGRELIRSALQFILKNSKSTRLALILNPDTEKMARNVPTLNHVIQGIMNSRDKMISGVAKFVLKVLNETNDFGQLVNNPDVVVEMSSGIAGFNKKKLMEIMSSDGEKLKTNHHLLMNKAAIRKHIGKENTEAFVICNGRVIGPLDESNVFTFDDFDLLQSFERDRSAAKITNIVQDMHFSNMPSEGQERFKADMVMKINAILSSKKQAPKTMLEFYDDAHSVIHFKPARKSISYSVTAILDPLSADAQKIVPILMVLVNVTNVDLKIFFNCKHKLSEMPLKRFYRYVLTPELSFDEHGVISNAASAVFHNMPQTALLTVNMDTPSSWMVEAVNSPYDLDNIHLAEIDDYVYGDFQLEYILVEGHCQDAISGTPPRGLQFILGTRSQPDMFDTIVMANLGYFQLKAFPGSFSLQLRDGRSSDIYKIDSMDGSDDHTAAGEFHVTVDSFTGRFLTSKVSRKEGKENEDLLGGDEKSQGIWDSITSYVSKDKNRAGTNDTIHIFSVATGRLYERFLRIMMLTVLKNTKNPVKFWFLKNYLSSTFTNFLPHMSKEYKFDYELVQYQWPSWLRKQTEKQRIIWGYKILFLDVLFPLNLNRVIFVDADQVVRTDLKELMEMDLEGAPYAYTPFCDDRTEMDGFRFWKQGYWRSHLGGRPYHISALYVVDLKQFRKMAAGDRLRGQYQGLSQDPNSLANLDQDLPNNMIHQVPIKSLPQEWLWCETWCSDESKKRAKTIDLCNNPQTKEPKLQRAIRIVDDWSELDGEIMKLQEKIAKGKESISETSQKHTDEMKKDEL